MDLDQALVLAEQFCRQRIQRWQGLQCTLSPATDISIDGSYVFVYRARQGRLGGAWPVIVDAGTGACRFVEGLAEYRSLRNRSSR